MNSLQWGGWTYNSARDVEQCGQHIDRHADYALEERDPDRRDADECRDDGHAAQKSGITECSRQRAPVVAADQRDAEAEDDDAEEQLEGAADPVGERGDGHDCLLLCDCVRCCVFAVFGVSVSQSERKRIFPPACVLRRFLLAHNKQTKKRRRSFFVLYGKQRGCGMHIHFISISSLTGA